MYASKIYTIAKRDGRLKKCFYGVLAANEIPKNFPVKHGAIINCCPRGLPGIHWVCIFKINKNLIEFYDPLGKTPEHYKLTNKLFKIAPKINYSSMRVQNRASNVCGYHCLFYLYYKSRGYSLNNILRNFCKKNTRENDRRVIARVTKLFNLKKT